MFRFVRLAHIFPSHPSRAGLVVSLAALILAAAPGARAQFNAPTPGIQVHDTSALHPPPGARVAIVEFMDMECPVCATTNPILEAAAAKYKIPLIRHDIPYHAWSPTAAVNIRWFESKSKALGEEYRDQVFANQQSLYNNPDLLRQFTDKFAQSHHIALPFSLDPQGKLAADVKADNDLGIRMGINATPTVFVVTSGGKGAPYVQVQRPDLNLYQVIDQAMADTAAPVKTAPAKTPAKKTASH